MLQSTGRHRRTRTLSIAAAVAVAAGAGGVCLGLSDGGAEAASTTVTVSSTAQLESAVKNAAAGTTIQVRGGTYQPAATLKSTANGTSSARITLQAYGSEKVRIDGSKLPAGSWLAGIYGDYWTVRNLTFVNSPAQGFVATSSVGGVFKNLVTADNGDSGFTLRGDGTTGNLVQNLDSHGNHDPAGHGQNADGIAVKFGSGTGNRITGARLYNNSDDGIDLWQFSSPVTVQARFVGRFLGQRLGQRCGESGLQVEGRRHGVRGAQGGRFAARDDLPDDRLRHHRLDHELGQALRTAPGLPCQEETPRRSSLAGRSPCRPEGGSGRRR
ncbi:right-handed parallel beta-helix repeat-containing protein [Streptomyces sp. HD]|uniref:right-handed parallel beta-helix repeat-containing protein n=1 Tax=Streptomyces sp. HD TaxID=3020892 RepID=UPI003FA75A4A